MSRSSKHLKIAFDFSKSPNAVTRERFKTNIKPGDLIERVITKNYNILDTQEFEVLEVEPRSVFVKDHKGRTFSLMIENFPSVNFVVDELKIQVIFRLWQDKENHNKKSED